MLQNPVPLGNLSSGSLDALGKSGERLENRIRAVQNSGQDQPEALRRVSQEFESLFISYLLKVMRETIEESGLTEGTFGKGIYTDLFDQELSRSVARAGGLGISDLLLRRLAPEVTGERPEKGPTPSPGPAKNRESEISDVLLPISAPVSSEFGVRRDPWSGQARIHKGLDLAAPAGTKILAPWGGKVISTGTEPGYGNYILLEHPEGFQTRYAHLASASVRKGDVVSAGEGLGRIGSSGRATGAHLHFEVIRSGKTVDPQTVLAEMKEKEKQGPLSAE